jgi:hypothetical protein
LCPAATIAILKPFGPEIAWIQACLSGVGDADPCRLLTLFMAVSRGAAQIGGPLVVGILPDMGASASSSLDLLIPLA